LSGDQPRRHKRLPAGKWYRKLLKPLIQAAPGETYEERSQVVSQKVVNVEFHGYHSVRFDRFPITLPSQRWLFERLRWHLDERAVLIGLRGRIMWETALPELRGRVCWAQNTQSSVVSPGNIEGDGFQRALDALRR
jgi:hypothetical protein